MAHLIYREKFFNRSNEPAWHAIGKNVGADAQYDAREALQVIGGAPPIVVQPLFTADGVEIPYQGIMRLPYVEDPEYACGGVVSEDYGFISHEEAVDIAYITMRDRHDNRVPVETMGFLRGGFELFISYVLPTVEVRNEEIRQFMLLHLPITGTDSASISRSGVRTVCANTLAMALSGTKEMYKVVHDETARERLAYWMRDMYTRFESRTEAVKEAMEIMAGHKVTADEMKSVLNVAYPLPGEPGKDAPPEVVDARMANWKQEVKRTEKYQTEAERLFLGDMRGFRSDLAGSGWYLYNAVAEVENYRRGGGGDREAQQVAASITFGDRRDTIERTFAAALQISRN